MRASVRWIRQISGLTASASDMAERLTRAGVEVEAIEAKGVGLDRVIVAEVHGKRPHPSRDRLTVVSVFDGRRTREVVCGAPNVPDIGGRVVLADVGATLPQGLTITAREVGGVRSEGMLASERELGIGDDAEGILVLGPDEPGRPGMNVVDALGLADEVLALSLTPNRPDCLGHLGLARELCALFGVPFAPKLALVPSRLLSEWPELPPDARALTVVEFGREHWGDTTSLVAPVPGVPHVVPISISASERCSRYVGTVVQRVDNGPSPFWVRYRLHVLGQRSIDRVVDATNLVLLETGHPIHAFDLSKIEGARIEVRLARDGEQIALLDGTTRTLTSDDLVIADARKPIALAGVMGGSESAIGQDTKHLLLEVAWFDPRSVRRTARRHGIHTESSHRFERGVDHGAIPLVTRRALTLFSSMANGVPAAAGWDAEARRIAATAIELAPDFVRDSIGDLAIADGEIRTILESLGCSVSPAEREGWRITAPTHRPDLTRPIDLVEEVARVRGYDRIPTTLFRPEPRSAISDARHERVRAVRRAALSAGFHEAVNYSFLSRAELERARVSSDAIELENPLSEERAVMRTSLVPGLLANVSRAERHRCPRGRMFEIGRRYLRDVASVTGATELLSLGLVAFGARDGWPGEGPAVDFYDGKGALEYVFAALGLEADFVVAEQLPSWLHPRRAAAVLLDGTALGHVGEVHPDVREAYDLATRPVVAEIDLEPVLVAMSRLTPRAIRPLPRFPAVTRDIALIVDDSVPLARVESVLRAGAGPLLESVAVFDVYRGAPVPPGKKSFALRLAYRDPEATLTDERVEAVQAQVLARAAADLGATLRA